MRMKRTERGFDLIEFADYYESQCSLQESSLATDDAIWLGVDRDFQGQHCTRMHLLRRQVKRLLPHLIQFVETGTIRLPAKKTRRKRRR